ncbi:2,3-bisphosphoglycerate-independent phosphoglycerate mutase [Pseudooctadecabacter jejudonensis]|uniref:2,3-bisphosphoglycerate-independent phosphoglycerate mutase n=1 Tax=Pseudooctadecabacter jejudonensis TaxID=1391910 RepID=A0A1Y5S497_9RHOB|nr:2,3-bisphosphoglycerate-independent phosphoglycerate mutase [Pseudooctadecabacter jejudonensis]SLN30858.1 2,3-bisphosphoglycerate-independent phosphoglycerate mutase [Pseudooctadecabacter jejudonensis]
MTAPKPVVLCILDGWGKRTETRGNAPALAATPNFDRVMQGPNAELITHGPDVGLPKGQMGNSEVGHTNIGAGRVVAMDLGAIDLAIEDGSFFENDALVAWCDQLASRGGVAHIMGLVSDGGVHGHIDHIQAALKAVTDRGLPVVLHAITDGRDVAPKSGVGFLRDLVERMPEGVTIGSVTGRYYAMDRDNRWERVETAYAAMVRGEGPRGDSAAEVVEAAYAEGVTDEFVPATVLGDYAGMTSDDGLFCLNFRADRAREILAAMGAPDFDGFTIDGRPDLDLLGMVDYSTAHNAYMTTCYPKQEITNTLGAWVARQGLRQFRVAETEKYPHVTFFLNGGVETPETGEDRYMAASPKVATYDLQPEMSAAEVAEAFVGAIKDQYDLIVCNFANPDMVGHTGDLSAAIAACEAVDAGLGRVLDALDAVGGAMIVTADHGNCETMIDPETGGPHTAHTINPVPVALVGGPEGAQLQNGRLADLAPTLLALMNVAKPDEMTGVSLIS